MLGGLLNVVLGQAFPGQTVVYSPLKSEEAKEAAKKREKEEEAKKASMVEDEQLSENADDVEEVWEPISNEPEPASNSKKRPWSIKPSKEDREAPPKERTVPVNDRRPPPRRVRRPVQERLASSTSHRVQGCNADFVIWYNREYGKNPSCAR
jgi:hypothetical protein